MSTENERYALALASMVGAPEPAADALAPAQVPGPGPQAAEYRASLENPNTPVTPETLAMLLSGEPTRSGVTVNEHSALTYTAVFAAIRILAESVGMLPMRVYQGEEDDNDRKRATWHPAYRMLMVEPNPEMTATVFKETMQGHLGGWGNAYAKIEFDNGGNARRLLPLLPDRTHPERVAGQLRYTVDNAGSFAPEEICHVPGLGFNGLKGYSPIGLAREAVALGKAAEFFGAGFFGNGAAVGGVLTAPGVLKPEQKAGIREAWQTMHAGVGNVARTALLDGGLAYTRVGIPPQDAQFLETRKFQVTEIARLYRIPPHMLADLERATFANIEHLSLEFLIYTLSPWLEKWEQELTRKLFPAGSNYYVEFDTRRLLRSDMAARKDYYATARQWGWYSANDVLRDEGMPSIGKEGDVYLSPSNMVAADQVGKVPPPAAPGAAPTDPPAGTDTPPQTRAEPPPAPLPLDGALRGIFEDAIARMLRKESNALGRAGEKRSGASFDQWAQRFYRSHAEDVRECVWPAVRSLAALLGRPMEQARDSLASVLDEFSARRHDAGVDVPATAAAEAEELTGRLTAALTGETHD